LLIGLKNQVLVGAKLEVG